MPRPYTPLLAQISQPAQIETMREPNIQADFFRDYLPYSHRLPL